MAIDPDVLIIAVEECLSVFTDPAWFVPKRHLTPKRTRIGSSQGVRSEARISLYLARMQRSYAAFGAHVIEQIHSRL